MLFRLTSSIIWLHNVCVISRFACICGHKTCLYLWSQDLFVYVVTRLVCICGHMTCLYLWSHDLFVSVVTWLVCICGHMTFACANINFADDQCSNYWMFSQVYLAVVNLFSNSYLMFILLNNKTDAVQLNHSHGVSKSFTWMSQNHSWVVLHNLWIPILNFSSVDRMFQINWIKFW